VFGVLQLPLLFLLVSFSVNNDWHGITWDAMEIFGKMWAHLVLGRAAMQHFAVSMCQFCPVVVGNAAVVSTYSFRKGDNLCPKASQKKIS
jgi:hypothetical protein